MKREVVQEFLELSGILGLALMDGRSRPCFYGISDQLNAQQKEALAQGLCQVLETTPPSFKTFEFHFSGTRAYIYKLIDGLVLLVLVDQAFQAEDYRKSIQLFKDTLEENIGTAISNLRYLAGAQSQGASRKRMAQASQTSSQKTAAGRVTTPPTAGVRSQGVSSRATASSRSVASQGGTATQGGAGGDEPGILKDYLTAINNLSEFSKKYLGTAVIVNYWKSSRPQAKWLEGFQIERSGQVSCLAENTQLMQQPVTEQQQIWLREWVTSFSKRCSTVIRDFTKLAGTEALSEHQRSLLKLK